MAQTDAQERQRAIEAAGAELHYQLDTAEGGPIRPRPIIDLFACIMELKLRQREGKPGWRDIPNDQWRSLFAHLGVEADELRVALLIAEGIPWADHLMNVWLEAADTANMALICADTAAPLPVLQPIDSRGRSLPASEAG